MLNFTLLSLFDSFFSHNNRTTSFILPEMTPIVKIAPSKHTSNANNNYSTVNGTNSHPTTVKFSNKQDVITNYTNEQQIKNQVNIEVPEPPVQQPIEVQQPISKPQPRVRKSGWIFKLNQTGFKLWKKRYFVLNETMFNYYSGKSLFIKFYFNS